MGRLDVTLTTEFDPEGQATVFLETDCGEAAVYSGPVKRAAIVCDLFGSVIRTVRNMQTEDRR